MTSFLPALRDATARIFPRAGRGFARTVAGRLRDEGVSLIFMAKVLLASCIALWIGYALDLDNPRWSVVSVFIVMLPESGLVLEKGFYRIAGTLVGCAASLAFVAAFAQYGELFLGAMAVWMGVFVACSMRYRNYQAYAWAMTGYTAYIVGLPAVANPDGAFAVAVARATEIAIGVGCAGLVSALILPRTSGDRLARQTRELFESFTGHVGGIFSGPDDAAADEAAQVRFMDALAAQDTAMSASAFEDPHNPGRVVRTRRLNRVLTRVATRLHQLRQLRRRLRSGDSEENHAHREIDALLTVPPESGYEPERLAGLLRARRGALAERVRALRPRIAGERAGLDFDTHAELADDFLAGFAEYAERYSRVGETSAEPEPEGRPVPTSRVDWLVAGITGLRATLTMAVLSWFWLATNWPDGATALVCGAISYALCAGTPSPVKTAWQTLVSCLITIVPGFLFRFVMMPQVQGFPMIFLALAPFLAFSAYLITKPRLFLFGLFFSVWFITLAGPENNPEPDLTAYLGQSIAALMGIGAGLVAFIVVLPGGSRWLRLRERVELRRQVVRACFSREENLAEAFDHATRAILRKISVNRSAGAGEGKNSRMFRWTFAALEIGGAMIAFREAAEAGDASGAKRESASRVKAFVARVFEKPSPENRLAAVGAVSDAIAAFRTDAGREGSSPSAAVTALHLLRTALLDPATPLDGEETEESSSQQGYTGEPAHA